MFTLMLQSAVGLIVFPLIAWLFSRKAQLSQFKSWAVAISMQLLLATMLLKLPWFQHLFELLNHAVKIIEAATAQGTSFVFGYLGGGELPFDEITPGKSYILAFRGLPLVVVIGALTALLSYWRILPVIIEGFSRVFAKTLNIGGAVALSGAANIFVGMIEAPLFIRNSMKKLSHSELFMVMTLGMSTVSGTVLILYVTFLEGIIDNPIGHIFTASIISVPASVLMAVLMVPYDGHPTESSAEVVFDYQGPIDAIAQGGVAAMQMVINVLALLITFIALVYLCNVFLGFAPDFGGEPLNLQRILGWVMAPLCWMMGIPWSEASAAGTLMGIKTVLNELIAFIEMSQLPEQALSPRSDLIMSYALCGFANFGSLGILIGGLASLVPERRAEITSLGIRSIISGTLATSMTASIIGIVTAIP